MNQDTKLYRVVQPWGRDRAVEASIISEHVSAVEAFAAIDAMAEQMVQTGAPSDAVELIVIDSEERIVPRRTS